VRDEAAYIRQAYENNEQREATLIATAIGNESGAGEDAGTTTLSLLNLIKNYSGSSTSSNLEEIEVAEVIVAGEIQGKTIIHKRNNHNIKDKNNGIL